MHTAAKIATLAALHATPERMDGNTTRSECLLAAAAHEQAMQRWADAAAGANTEEDQTFCQFLADTHEEHFDFWRDEAKHTPERYPSLYKTARVLGEYFKVVGQDTPKHEDITQLLLEAREGSPVWIYLEDVDPVL